MNKMEKFQLVDLTQEKLAEVLDKTRWAADMQWQELLNLMKKLKQLLNLLLKKLIVKKNQHYVINVKWYSS